MPGEPMSDLTEFEERLRQPCRYILTGLVGFLGLSALYHFFFDGFGHVDLGLGILLTTYSVVVWKS